MHIKLHIIYTFVGILNNILLVKIIWYNDNKFWFVRNFIYKLNLFYKKFQYNGWIV